MRDARIASGVSQRSLARRAGTSQAAISRIERGLEEPTLERFEQILAGLGWKLETDLVPIAEHEAEPRRLWETARMSPQERFDAALAAARFAREIERARRSLAG